jgi:hypothetical protein
MSTGRHSFKHNDAARLIRAVEAAGKRVVGVTLKDGLVTIVVDGASPVAAPTRNDLDTWMEKHEAQTSRD